MQIAAPFVLFDDARAENGMRLYAAPKRVLDCRHAEDVHETLRQIDQALADGFHVAGYLAYELGYLLEPKLASLCPKDLDGPLIWMGVFEAPRDLDRAEAAALLDGWADEGHSVGAQVGTQAGAQAAAMTRDRYLANVETIRDHIRAGDVYQINYTFKQGFDFSGSPLSLYAELRRRQRAAFGAVIATGDQHIVSLSPELFVEVQDGTARTRPMKGTAARGASPEADSARRHWLSHDEKSMAENLMIVDLLRNDLGRIAEVGTVKVTDLFTVETYPTLHQMTSGIEAKLRPDTSFANLLGALFPCGSVTGAPKVKTMEIIRTLEDGPRGVYTGAIGYASAQDGTRFNVAIRTLVLDQHGHGEIGIGSGIVYDSEGAAEWDECHLKARFLTGALTDTNQPPFQLLETLKWESAGGYALLQRHLERLADAAAFFCYPFDEARVQAALDAAVDTTVTGHTQAQRVRLTLDDEGHARVEVQPLAPLAPDAVMTFALSDKTVDVDSPFTYHKTTNRAFYDMERERMNARTGCAEVLFLNDQGQLTEGSITNVFVEKDGQLLTPPTQCGLLAGTLRRELLETGRAAEAVLTLADLEAPNRVFLGNSVRGLVPAVPIFLPL